MEKKVKTAGDQMRKLIPFIIVALFLVAGFVGVNIYSVDLTTQDAFEDDYEFLTLSNAMPTLSLDPPSVEPAQAQSASERGSRFAMTTNTIITVDSPDVNTTIAYG